MLLRSVSDGLTFSGHDLEEGGASSMRALFRLVAVVRVAKSCWELLGGSGLAASGSLSRCLIQIYDRCGCTPPSPAARSMHNISKG